MSPRALHDPFFRQLAEDVAHLGGMHNAHLHLDRAGTFQDRYLADAERRVLASSHVSLHEKHALIGAIHSGPAYDPDDLRARVGSCLDVMAGCGTRRADTLVDVTPDRVGLSALETLGELKRERAGEIDLRLGAYTPFGFRDDQPEHWELFERGAEQADFIAALPEADELDEYPDHIGFEEHCRRTLELAQRLDCMIHVHTDQRNEPGERGTERLVTAVREHGAPAPVAGEPSVWAIHAISPATYEEGRWERLVEGLLETGIGIVCCPSAALGMRQLRPLRTPTWNSIPRVLELLAAGVQVRLGSDNIGDICSPSTTADLTDEVLVLSAAIRFYDVGVLARLAAGAPLEAGQRAAIREHLMRNDEEIARMLERHAVVR